MPPSTRRGIGTDDGPEVSTSGAACGSPLPPDLRFHPSRRSPPFPDPELPSPGVGSFPPGARWPSRADCKRARDDVLGVRVRADVRRDRVDRLLVAVVRVEAVDAPVVEPVAEHLLAARCRRAGGRRHGQRRRGRQRDDDQRDERAALTTGCHVWDLTGRSRKPMACEVFRRGVMRSCGQSKRFVGRTRELPCRSPGKTGGAASVARHGSGVGAPGPGLRCRRPRRRCSGRRGAVRSDVRGRRLERRRDAARGGRGCRPPRNRPRRGCLRLASGAADRPLRCRAALGAAPPRRVDRRHDLVVDRRRSELGRVQQEPRVRGLSRARLRAGVDRSGARRATSPPRCCRSSSASP